MCTYMFHKFLGEIMQNYVDLYEIVADYGYDPFERIENFILKEVIPKYECLTTVHRSYFDECGFPAIEFYIRYNVKLSFEQNQKLYSLVTEDIRTFCRNNDLWDAYEQCCFLITVSGDAVG